jgi:nucleoside-diphosphate-sugar epimerase
MKNKWRKKMRALVIGGSGMFGRKTVLRMLQDPDFTTVVSMDLAPPPAWIMKEIDAYKDRFHFVRGDVSQLEDILNAMSLYPVDGIVNWAFVMREVNNQPRLAAKVNALGMCNAFEAGRLMGANRVVYASSETVYGPQDRYGDREVVEDDQLYPSHSYAVCKRFAEILADEYSQIYGMKFTGVRPTIGYGHGGASPAQYWSDMPSFAAVGKPFHMEMDGTSLSSLVSADDLGELTKRLIKAPSSPHPVYNVGGPPTSAKDLAAVVKKFIPDAQITFGTRQPPGRGGLPWKVSQARGKEDFGFECMPIEESVLIHINDARTEAGLPLLKG